MRIQTRRQRYDVKLQTVLNLPVSFVTVNFDFDDNLAFLIRNAACFGMKNIYVIGTVPSRSVLNPKSGSTVDYVNIVQFKNPMEFLMYSRLNNIKLVSAELTDRAESLYDYRFSFDVKTAIVLGNETTGVPVELSRNSDIVYIPMPGAGAFLNTSQTGTAFATEYSRQYFVSKV